MSVVLTLLAIPLVLLIGAALVAAIYTQKRSTELEEALPAIGTVTEVDGLAVHYLDVPASDADAPVVVFLHGASGNLRDPHLLFGDRFEGRVRQIYIDRPGHGWSERGPDMHRPDVQANHVIKLLDKLNVREAVFFGHSWSGTVIGALGVLHPERVSGLLFSAPVAYPWPGGVNWYYDVAAIPVIGKLFTRTLTLPVGQKQIDCATHKVFWPNKVPENYRTEAGPDLVLEPHRFWSNSQDVALLRPWVVEFSPRFKELRAPMTVITGDKDQIVLPWVHTDGLEKNVPHAKTIWLKDTGHMPHYADPDLFVSEILALTFPQSEAIAAE